jgi:hypothetical protein
VTRGEHALHAFPEERVEAGVGIAEPGLLRQGNRPLCQALEDQVVELPMLDEFDSGLDTVPGVSGAAPDAKRALGRRGAARGGDQINGHGTGFLSAS